jgi:predicted lipid-binding transport protein (Tim44 family)
MARPFLTDWAKAALVPAAVVVAALLAPQPAETRPGGGQSYSGSRSSDSSSSSSSRSGSSSRSNDSSSSSRSGSSASDDASDQNVHMTYVSTPATLQEKAFFIFMIGSVGLTLAWFGVSSLVAKVKRRGQSGNWDSSAARAPAGAAPERWAAVRAVDPDFSAVLFDDFVYTLYATAQRARHDQEALAALAPYLAPEVRTALQARPPRNAPVEAVIVGAVRVASVNVPSNGDQWAVVEIEANVTARAEDGPRGEYSRERWTLCRRAGARTRPWTGVRTLGCPACGAPFQLSGDDRCAWCGQVVGTGRFDWQVVDVGVQESDERPPALLGEDTEEQGTDLPTRVDPAMVELRTALIREDPAFSERALFERLQVIYATLNSSWAAQDLRPIRPYVSDAMFNYLSYWIESYRAQGLRNAVESARILKYRPARIQRDRHFDAFTFRLWATGFEVTTEAATGKVLRGSRKRERPYSEYWTLIRGAAVRGTPRADAKCPSCGAPLDVNMAGQCEHCGVHVTSGEFDWVLSRIEQDDSYQG